NSTGVVYEFAFGLVLAGLTAGLLAVVLVVSKSGGGESRRRLRLLSVAKDVALMALALGGALPPLFQPTALRMDTGATYAGPVSWTPSPSPETSFWGNCSPGWSHGFCASGWFASWAPGLGWDLLVIAVALLVSNHFVVLRNQGSAAGLSPGSIGRDSGSRVIP
ncbi:MAG TPA: hypothetical protein VJS68_02025, partial [Thermoplasmata archaeon]|nr:hypothetical protein [Thermoplasmata archaeon]